MSPPKLLQIAIAWVVLARFAGASAWAQGWPVYGHDAQHTTLSATASQIPQQVRWSTPVDLAPQYSGDDLFIHYGSPVVTAGNTVILPVKTGASGGFQVAAHNANNGGAPLWTLNTDYTVPIHGWFPICGVTLTPDGSTMVVPGAGGTVLMRTAPDSAAGTTTRVTFYCIANYNADPTACNAAIQICTPITSDALGNLYFGYTSSGAALPGYPSGIPSGLARISSTGKGSFVSAVDMSGDSSMVKPAYNCAPALSSDGSTVYMAVTNVPAGSSGAFGHGYLCAVDSATLAPKASVFLLDPRSTVGSPLSAYITDDSSASPTVGPDGDVYFGVLEGNFPSNNDRGWLLHFSGDLSATKLAGAFGWDDTPSVVPASAVPSYTGPSAYLLLTKYNNYAGIHTGDGVNRLALLDPGTSFTDPVTGATAMNPFLTVKGVTPDPEFVGSYPNAVREWCINSAAVDPINHCAVVNSEDGQMYRWDFTKATDEPGQLSRDLSRIRHGRGLHVDRDRSRWRRVRDQQCHAVFRAGPARGPAGDRQCELCPQSQVHLPARRFEFDLHRADHDRPGQLDDDGSRSRRGRRGPLHHRVCHAGLGDGALCEIGRDHAVKLGFAAIFLAILGAMAGARAENDPPRSRQSPRVAGFETDCVAEPEHRGHRPRDQTD